MRLPTELYFVLRFLQDGTEVPVLHGTYYRGIAHVVGNCSGKSTSWSYL